MTKVEKRLYFIVCMIVAAFISHHLPAHAQQPVKVGVRLILASNEAGFSPALQDLSGSLRSLFKYKGYKLLTSTATSVSPGKPSRVDLPYGTHLEITVADGKSDGIPLLIKWIKPPRGEIVSTQVRLQGRNPVLIGGPTVKDGVLIVALGLQ